MQKLSERALRLVPCEDAQAFISALSPSNALWGPEPTDWIFRGHRVSAWPLLPSALRPGELRYHHNRQPILYNDSPFGFIDRDLATDIVLNEFYHIKDFFEECDNSGLHIPGDSHEHRTVEGLNELGSHISSAVHNTHSPAGFMPWPIGTWLHVYALAQHYGMKTRLLDWTRKPRVAAYFAARQVAEDVSKNRYEQQSLVSEKLCVWAINKKKLLTHRQVIFNEPLFSQHVRFVTAPQASNPNLNAQAGLFMVDGNPRRRVPFDSLISNGLDGINDETVLRTLQADPIMLTKIELPYLHARKLLRLLARELVTAASVYPGYHGVALALEERAFWDQPSPP